MSMKFLYLIVSFLFLSVFSLNAQPCNTIQIGLTCDEAAVLCNIMDLNGYCTKLPDFSNPTGPSPLCNGVGVPNNTIWIGFVAGSTYNSITITPLNCDGIQPGIKGGIYSGTCENLESVVCQGVCTNSPLNLASNAFIPGKVYWILIDGCNASVCDITIDVNAGSPLTLGQISPISGPTKICLGGPYEYSSNLVNYAKYYYWTLDGVIQNDPETEDNIISLDFNTPGVHHLCMDVGNYCIDEMQLPAAQCLDITVENNISHDDPAPVKICANDTYLYNGLEYTPGQYQVKLHSSIGCDSIVTLTVEAIPFVYKDLGKIYKCKGDCITIKDNYGHGGVYCDEVENKTITLQSWQGCDSLVKYSLRNLSIDTKITVPNSLNCLYSKVDLDASLSKINNSVLNTYKWTDSKGAFLGDAYGVSVDKPGKYCLVIAGQAPNGLKCSDTACVTVFEDHTKPIIQTNLVDTVLTCMLDSICLLANSTDTLTDFHWLQPDSALTSGSNICIRKPGNYTLLGIASNYCKDTVSFNISSSFKFKSVFERDSLLCYRDTIIINYQKLIAPSDYSYNDQLGDTCITFKYHLKLKNIGDTTLHICKGSSDVFKDTVINKSGVYVIPFNTLTGCDSIYITTVIEDPIDSTKIDVTANNGTIYYGHIITKDTILTILLKNQFGCDSTIIANIKVLTSTKDIVNSSKIKVVPNPAKNLVTISTNEILEFESFEIYNSLGQQILNKQQKSRLPIQLDISSWPPNMYVIKFKKNESIEVASFIKQE